MTSPIENHPGQKKLWFDKSRFVVCSAGRRFGKTFYMRETLLASSRLKNGLFWYLAPTRDHAKDLMWDDLKEGYDRMKWRYSKNEVDLSIKRLSTGAVTRLRSAERPDRLRGKGLNGALFDEYADMKPEVFLGAVRPALSDKRGWAKFFGTPKGYNHFHDLAMRASSKVHSAEWSFHHFRTIDSPFFQTEVGRAEIESARRDLDERTFRQEYEASFESFSGRLVHAFDRSKHDTDITLMPDYPLYVGMDFNRNPMSFVFSQRINGQSVAVKEYSVPISSTDECCRIIKDAYPSWSNYGVIVRPDATGKRRTSNSSRSDHEIIRGHGFKIEADNSNPTRVDRWASANKAFESDSLLVNTRTCPKLTKELETISYKEGTCEPDIRDPLVGHLFDAFTYDVYRDHKIVKQKTVRVSSY